MPHEKKIRFSKWLIIQGIRTPIHLYKLLKLLGGLIRDAINTLNDPDEEVQIGKIIFGLAFGFLTFVIGLIFFSIFSFFSFIPSILVFLIALHGWYKFTVEDC